eukprot:CAMPEP_0113475834 /NCGR_PEP_ID=MMETSP0014_2-20120614/19337_1 /TAXON_ID=2857 /ORGANISM="Nitzschia sp." /LENGTH=558 /DNA_ID=CAMNT_0000368791 /DNA_START=136 /DNA_END=1809 /DNA_ORIENTATION=+ /assembly_acc=CAM_ASM_000159
MAAHVFDAEDVCVLAPMVRGSEKAFRSLLRHYHQRDHHQRRRRRRRRESRGSSGSGSGGGVMCYSPMLRSSYVLQGYEIWKARQRLQQQKQQQQQEQFDSSRSAANDDHRRDSLHEDTVLFLEDLASDSSDDDNDDDDDDDNSGGDDDDIKNLVVQLCGNDPSEMYQATLAVLERTDGQIAGVDFNLGCPQSCARDGRFGAFLAENSPRLAIECLQAMVQARDEYCSRCCCEETSNRLICTTNRNENRRKIITVSTKIRLSLDLDVTLEFVNDLRLKACVDYVTVHCRHRHVKFNGVADLEHAGRTILETFSTCSSRSSVNNNNNNTNAAADEVNRDDDGDDTLRGLNTTTTTTTTDNNNSAIPFIWINGADIRSYDDIWKTYRQLGVVLPATTEKNNNQDDDVVEENEEESDHTTISCRLLPKLMIARNWLARPDLLSSSKQLDGIIGGGGGGGSSSPLSSTSTSPSCSAQPSSMIIPAILASGYLEYARKYPPPNELYFQTHFRWFFRSRLLLVAPPDEHDGTTTQQQPPQLDYKNNWRHRFWSFLHRPYLKRIEQ